MAAPRTTSSPRDHTADANPGLARKKQRFSEEAQGKSADDRIVIEAFETEDSGNNIENAIQIEDDPSINMEPYSDDFNFCANGMLPITQLNQLQQNARSTTYLDLKIFFQFAHAVDQHVARTANESREWRQQYLVDEAEFFDKLCFVCFDVLMTGDLMEPHVNEQASQQAFETLCTGLIVLTHRIIPLLPVIIKGVLSRRDSAQGSARQQPLLGLGYVVLAQRLLGDTNLANQLFFHDRRRLDHIMRQTRTRFFDGGTVESLAKIIETLSESMAGVKDSWPVMQSALHLLRVATGVRRKPEAYPKDEIEQVMQVVNTALVPAICAKHPRALPAEFHADIIAFGKHAILTHILRNDEYSAAALYERFVKAEHDAVLPHTTGESSTTALLLQLCDGDLNILGPLLSISWAMQTFKKYISSEIMDIRNVGVTLLKDHLITLYDTESKSSTGIEHPTLQFAVRFLRENEITAYLFGPESRAGLVHHSADIIGFLGATSTYTNAETDIIWKACSTSVEADFVKASFVVLTNLKRFLHLEHLIYIAKQYTTSSVERLDPAAFDFLDNLLGDIEQHLGVEGASSERLEVVYILIEILKRTNSPWTGPVRDRLRKLCIDWISRVATRPEVNTEEKKEIYKHCVPDILQSTAHATTAVEVLNVLLSVRVHTSEAEHVLDMLPVGAAINDFCSYVDSNRSETIASSSIFGATARLTYITRLMVLGSGNPSEQDSDQLFDLAFGKASLCNAARDDAWVRLFKLSDKPAVPSAATFLWNRYMGKHVPSLDVDIASPKLLEAMNLTLRPECIAESGPSWTPHLLGLPLWKTLVRFATTSTERGVLNQAITFILNLLFEYPLAKDIQPSQVIQRQTEFVHTHLGNLRQEYDSLLQSDEPSRALQLSHGIDLLIAMLNKDREILRTQGPVEERTTLILDIAGDDSRTLELDTLHFSARIPDLGGQSKTVDVRTTTDAKVSDLLARLPEITGTEENRVIAGGREISLKPNEALTEACVQQASTVLICPKYTFSMDLDRVLERIGPIEKAIVKQHDHLECFLDGPTDIAHKVYLFLITIRQPPQTRVKVSSASATADSLIPPDRQWRCAFSLQVLQRHLLDFARLGVIDQGFVDRTIDLLVQVILDESRPFSPLVLYEVSSTLSQFLDEKTPSEDGGPMQGFEHQFIYRMMSLLSEGIALPLESLSTPSNLTSRASTVCMIYKALMTACRRIAGLWSILGQATDITKLHGDLLLEDDTGLAVAISQQIGSICQDITIPQEIPNLFWQTLYPILPAALRKPLRSAVYLDLTRDVLNSDTLTQLNESKVRSVIGTLTCELWTYRHSESILLPLPDKTMGGLMKLLSRAVTILKSFKKSLELQGLSSRLLKSLLFPPLDEAERHPLITSESRLLVYDVLKYSFEPSVDYDNALDIALRATHASSRAIDAPYPGHQEWFRPPWNPAGLFNLGMTCYMNSLLQQFFTNLQFRRFILEQPLPYSHDSKTTLAQVQGLLGRMQNSTQTIADTNPLARSLNVQVGNQEDVHTFYTGLLSRLEDDMSNQDSKRTLNKFFTGNSITQIKGDCGHVSSRTESFTELSVTVKNKGSLAESLNEFVQGEPLEGANKYMCMTCNAHNGGRLVDAVRRTCLEDVPDNLTFCLKRFTYESMIEGENKVNDRFEFPSAIDMSFYKRVHLEKTGESCPSDEFELVGVIVHQGSLQFGHYWSYVRMPGATNSEANVWMYLEDTRSFRVAGGVQEVQEQCFGGQRTPNGHERADNAYVLFYQRKSYIKEASDIDTVAKHLRNGLQVLPRVQLPEDLANEIEANNKWRQHVESLFDAQFGFFIVWLLRQSPAVLEARAPDLSDGETSSSASSDGTLANDDIEAKLGDLIANYTSRVLLANKSTEATLDDFMTSVLQLLEAYPNTAAHMLRSFSTTDGFGFTYAVYNESMKVRSQVFDGIWKCLMHLRAKKPSKYADIWPKVIDSHATVVGPSLHGAFGKWDEFLGFAAKFARLGFHETGIILSQGYLIWALELLMLRWDAEARKGHMLWPWLKNHEPDLSGVVNFVFNILSKHVDLSVDCDELASLGEQRTHTSRGWCLMREELETFLKTKGFANFQGEVPMIIFAPFRQCTISARWEDFAPGRLFSLLVSDDMNPEVLRVMKAYFLEYHEYEDGHLTPLLYITLHYLRVRPDEENMPILIQLCKNLVLWNSSDKEIIAFFEQAYRISPRAVMNSVPYWVPKFLGRKKPIPGKISAFLRTLLFATPAVTDDARLDATRIATTRALVKPLMDTVAHAYQREEARLRYEGIIEVLKGASPYLLSLRDEVMTHRENDVRLGHEITVQHDEIRGLTQSLVEVLDALQEWELEAMIPIASIDIRRSTERESEEDEESEAYESEDLN